MEEGDEEAKKELAEANLTTCCKYCQKICWTEVCCSLILIQEGNLGLIKAVEKFDYSKGI